MATIKAPFNFVPLNEKVFFPDWADKISQDIPFKDGVSGFIELKITAKTPVFVRNGHSEEDQKHKTERYKSFSKSPDGRYFIPATSISGAIRSVLETMSFGKMTIDKSSAFAAQRDLKNSDVYPLTAQQDKIHCGWIVEDGKGGYQIEDCGRPYRIGQKCIDKYLGVRILEDHFKVGCNFDIQKKVQVGDKEYDPRTAAYKYYLLKDYEEKLYDLNFCVDEAHNGTEGNRRVRVCGKSESTVSGSIVLTGQPNQWKYPRPTTLEKNAGKFYEFVFPNTKERDIPFSSDIFDEFKYIYQDSPEWDRMTKTLEETGIPVFFRVENNAIKDLGIAYLYKLPYENTPYDLLDDGHKSEQFDLAECMFGTLAKGGMKGRIQFSPAFSANAQKDKDVVLTLGSPKASYYPMYISQNGQPYKTYNNGKLSGRKRYPVRSSVWNKSTGDEKIDTLIHPLKAGSVFTGKVRFHNLKPVELGALLSAITFHNTPGCFHQIGQAKPYGYGKVSMETVLSLYGTCSTKNAADFMTDFEEAIQTWMDKNMYHVEWNTSDQMKQLFTMSHQEISGNDAFTYMVLDPKSRINDFTSAKADNLFLKPYTVLSKTSFYPQSLYGPVKKERLQARKEAMEAERINANKQLCATWGLEYCKIKNVLNKLEEGFESQTTNPNQDALNAFKEEYQQLLDSIRELESRDELSRQKLSEAGVAEDMMTLPVNNVEARIRDLDTMIRKSKRQDEGLSELDRLNVKGEYTITKFSQICNDITRYLKAVPVIPEDQYCHIRQVMKRVYASLKPRDQKEWQSFEGKLWKTVISWTDEATAQSWYNEIVKK